MATIFYPPDKVFPVKVIDGIDILDFSDIIHLEAADKLTFIYLMKEKKVVRSTLTLSKIEEMLPPAFFFRCHRSHIVGLRHLKKFENGVFTIYLTDNQYVPLAKDRLCDFLKWIGYKF